MTFRLGLTGGIGMGKSTAAQMFRELGHPVWDADEAVHRLYAAGGAAVAPVLAAFPDAGAPDGGIDREALKVTLAEDPEAFKRLEAIVHPLVAADRQTFIKSHKDKPLVVLDIPLLFETRAQSGMDGVAVVSAPIMVQRRRVMARPGMTQKTLDMITDRQMPDADKRALADWVIPSETMDGAMAAVMDIVSEVMARRR